VNMIVMWMGTTVTTIATDSEKKKGKVQ